MESLTLLAPSYSSSVPFFALNKPSKPKPSCLIFCSSSSNSRNNKKNNKKTKDDSHFFVPRPDESTGPFPESVLLKKKIVEKDGQFLPEFVDDEEERVYQTLKLQLEDDSQYENLRHYEVVYLIHEKYEDEVATVNEKIKAFLGEKRAKIWRESDWGMRRLAYKIQKAKNAHYFLMNFEIEARWINDFKTMLDKDERVIRHLVMKKDEAETQDCPPPPEFHTLRANMDADEDELDFDDDDDEEYDDNEEEETEDGIIYVDDEEGDDDGGNIASDTTTGNTIIGKSRAEKVAR